MLAQSASAQAAEASVIAGFNSRLATKIAQFQANNTGVRLSSLTRVIHAYPSSYPGQDFLVGRQCSIYHYSQLAHHLRLPGRHVVRVGCQYVLGVSLVVWLR